MEAETVERLVADALEAEVRSWYRPRSGSVAETVVCRLETGDCGGEDRPSRVVCKRGGASVWTDDVIEPLVLEYVAEATDLPVPRVLASGSVELEGESNDPLERWAIYEFREGRNPGPRYLDLEPAVRRRLVADAGELLGRLHATSALAFDRVGGLARGADDRSLRLRAPDGWHAVDPGWPLTGFPVPLAGDEGCRPVVTHGDYQPSNLLVDDEGAVTAVLDWGNAHVTHAEYALARAEARFVDVYAGRLPRAERERLRGLFRRAYANDAPLETGFDRRASIYKLLWVAQSGANYLRIAREPRGRRQLRTQVRRLLE
ncbi:phosphotransferase family protein [Natronorubrum texcoconense]|uniref:Phosphotransferase enzyme family protein n=1 Tax=Natronorubrum texcoconense TaxID=1095776 RepID=A0A1G9B5V7_9EURY|nr:aminoglycoside phosphotransferase family protein [Natronorubrum texcoconense]SDK34897.1 Phosphotransferase enzyme family protein [Natronorubrum texcoconense]